jgi:hypothetical protein
MFSVLMQTFWLLFGSGAELFTPPQFVSCRVWTHQSVEVTQTICLCRPIGSLDFCAGDVWAEAPFLKVYPYDTHSVPPYLHIRLRIQGD